VLKKATHHAVTQPAKDGGLSRFHISARMEPVGTSIVFVMSIDLLL
jgi:hypothetical protein